MPASSLSTREMLEVQFRKAIRKGVTNAFIAPTFRNPGVPKGETVVVEVINKESVGVPFTETGFLAASHGFVRYEDIQEVHWISPEGSEVVRLKRTHSDRLMLKLKSGGYLTMDGLGPAFQPVMRFLEWAISRKESEPVSTEQNCSGRTV